MSRELLYVIDQISYERGLDRQTVVKALETALTSASRKRLGPTGELRAVLREDSGELEIYCTKTVVEQPADPLVEISLAEAHKIDPAAEMGTEVEALTNLSEFGRIAAQTAKQVIIQRVREAERELIHEDYKDRAGEIITGIVHHKEKGDLYVDLDKTEGILSKRDQIPRESYRNGDRIRAFIQEVSKSVRGPQIILSRTSPEFLVKLFELEVPEIREGIVKVRGAARDPGERAKIAVESTSPEVDPVGACVGMKGSRVQSVVRELRGEKVDIVEWSPDADRFLRNALSPAEIERIEHDDEHGKLLVIVSDDQLSLTIGKKGQNVRLASQLLSREVDVKSHATLDREERVRHEEARRRFLAGLLGVRDGIVETLVESGLGDLRRITDAGTAGLMELKGVGEKTAETVLDAARTALSAPLSPPPGSVHEVDGLDTGTAELLAGAGILIVADLAAADAATVAEATGLDEEAAAALIQKAGSPEGHAVDA